jgi:hypothetical protein
VLVRKGAVRLLLTLLVESPKLPETASEVKESKRRAKVERRSKRNLTSLVLAPTSFSGDEIQLGSTSVC